MGSLTQTQHGRHIEVLPLQKKNNAGHGGTPLTPELGRQKQVNLWELEASLIFMPNSRQIYKMKPCFQKIKPIPCSIKKVAERLESK